MASKVKLMLAMLLLFSCLSFYVFCALLLKYRNILHERHLVYQDMMPDNNVPWIGPSPDEANIMFVEMSCALQQMQHRLTPRQACAIESASRAHPLHQIYVFHTCTTDMNKDLGVHPDPYMQHFYRYPNVFFLHLNVSQMVGGTIVEDWWAKKPDISSQWQEVIGLLLLWKNGGIYMDLDFVVVRNLSQLSANFIGAEGETLLATKAFGFSAVGSGHEQVEEFLREINSTDSTYSGNKWSDNGQNLLTRVMLRSCNVSQVYEMTTERCNGVRILPSTVFYPNAGNDIQLFEKDDENHTITESLIGDERTKAVHVGNQLSRNVGSDEVYGILAAQFCPLVYSHCGNTF